MYRTESDGGPDANSRWYALKNARVPPAIVLSRLRRGKNGQTPDPRHEEGTTARLQHLHSSPARAQKKPCGIRLKPATTSSVIRFGTLVVTGFSPRLEFAVFATPEA